MVDDHEGSIVAGRRGVGRWIWFVAMGGVEQTKPQPCEGLGFRRGAGDGLLSRDLSIGVPSALQGLTIVFGMGTSMAPALKSPAFIQEE